VLARHKLGAHRRLQRLALLFCGQWSAAASGARCTRGRVRVKPTEGWQTHVAHPVRSAVIALRKLFHPQQCFTPSKEWCDKAELSSLLERNLLSPAAVLRGNCRCCTRGVRRLSSVRPSAVGFARLLVCGLPVGVYKKNCRCSPAQVSPPQQAWPSTAAAK
jgi:hypothetical protein